MIIAAWPAHAAIAVVQTASCEAQGATTCNAGPITTTNGNLFVANISYCCAAFTSIADNKSNVYGSSIATISDSSGGSIRQDYIAAGSGGSGHTFTVTGASAAFFATLSVIEVSGAAASPLDQTASAADVADTTSHSSGSTASTSQANELLIGLGGGIDITTYTNDGGAGWTERTNVSTDIDSEGIITGTKIVSAIGTYAYTFTTGSSVDDVMGISTWKESAASSTRQRCIGCGTDKKVIGE